MWTTYNECFSCFRGLFRWIQDFVYNQSRRSHRRCSVIKSVLRKFAKFTKKHLRYRLFFNKVASIRHATLLRKSLWHRCFPVNFAKFLKTFFYRTSLDACFCQRFKLQFIVVFFRMVHKNKFFRKSSVKHRTFQKVQREVCYFSHVVRKNEKPT